MKIWLIGISLTALFGFFSIFGWFSDKVEKKADKTEVKEVEVKVEKNVEDIDTNENVTIKQTVLLEQLTTSVTELNRQMMAR